MLVPGKPDTRWTDNEHIAAMLDGIDTLPCHDCGEPCSVPEYVLLVEQTGSGFKPVAICQQCTEKVAGEVADTIARTFLGKK
jgi:hypothetical protein